MGSRSVYRRWARLYDVLAGVPGVRSWREQAADALTLSAGDTVVEMGCGTGANVPYLRQRIGTGGQIVGVDATREMVQQADRHEDRVGHAIHYVQGDATRPPVASADALLATFVAGIFEKPGSVVRRWCDLVGPGGRVALLNFQRSDRPLAAPANIAFEAFVRISAPGGRLSLSSQAARFEKRIAAGREALREQTEETRVQTFGGGYVGLVSGRVAGR